MIDLSHLPPVTQNNMRKIALQELAHFEKWPSDKLRDELETKFGIVVDHSDADWGTGPRGGRE